MPGETADLDRMNRIYRMGRRKTLWLGVTVKAGSGKTAGVAQRHEGTEKQPVRQDSQDGMIKKCNAVGQCPCERRIVRLRGTRRGFSRRAFIAEIPRENPGQAGAEAKP